MANSELYVVVPLANDDDGSWTGPGPNSKARAEKAIEVARALQSQEVDVLLAQGAGAPVEYEHTATLAQLNADYLQRACAGIPIVVNDHDVHAYGTLREMQWIVLEMVRLYPDRSLHFVFVTQRRHLLRTRAIGSLYLHKLYLPPLQGVDLSYHYVCSGQTKEVPLHHEVRGYVKVLLYLCGLGEKVDEWRRGIRLKVDRSS